MLKRLRRRIKDAPNSSETREREQEEEREREKAKGLEKLKEDEADEGERRRFQRIKEKRVAQRAGMAGGA